MPKFTALLRSNFRFGRMQVSRTNRSAGRFGAASA